MMNNDVIYRAKGTAHVVYQPNAEIELYIPAMAQPAPGLPNGAELLIIPATRPTFETLRAAWEWHIETYKDNVIRQHAAIDSQTAGSLAALMRQSGAFLNGNGRKVHA